MTDFTSVASLSRVEKPVYLYLLAWDAPRFTRLELVDHLGMKRAGVERAVTRLYERGLLRDAPLEPKNGKAMSDGALAAFIRKHPDLTVDDLAAALGFTRQGLYDRAEASVVAAALDARPRKGQSVLRLEVDRRASPVGYVAKPTPLPDVVKAAALSVTTLYLYLRGVESVTVKDAAETLGMRVATAYEGLRAVQTQSLATATEGKPLRFSVVDEAAQARAAGPERTRK